jgi:hypothetical protein
VRGHVRRIEGASALIAVGVTRPDLRLAVEIIYRHISESVAPTTDNEFEKVKVGVLS